MVSADGEGSGGGEDGVKMGAESDGRGFGVESGAGGEEVADSVDGGGEAERLEALAEPGGAIVLGEGGRGDGGDGELEVGYVALMAGEPVEEAMGAGVGCEAGNVLGEGGGSGAGLPGDP